MSNDPFVVPPTTGGCAYTDSIADIRDDTPPQAGDDVLVEYDNPTVIALCVEGDSLNQVAPEGSLIIIGYSVKTLRDGEMGVFRRGGEAAFNRCKGRRIAGHGLNRTAPTSGTRKCFPPTMSRSKWLVVSSTFGLSINARLHFKCRHTFFVYFFNENSALFANGPKRRAGFTAKGDQRWRS